MTDSLAIDWTDETLRTLDDLAHLAFPKESGVTGKTLQRLAREGKLVVYKPGGKYLSTLANVRVALDATRPKPPTRPRPATPDVPNGLGLTESELARMRCMRALEKLREQVDEKKRVARLQRDKEKLLRKAGRDAERRK